MKLLFFHDSILLIRHKLIHTICSTPNNITLSYLFKLIFHKSFWWKIALDDNPWMYADILEYKTSHVFNSTPQAVKPFLAAAKTY